MLGSPIATIEGGIDVVTNVRRVYDQYTRKAGGIDVRHFKSFREVLNLSWEENRVLKY